MRSITAAFCLVLMSAGFLGAQETEADHPLAMAGLTAGAATWNGDGANAHLSASFELPVHPIRSSVAVEGGFIVGSSSFAGTFTPGIMVDLTASPSPPYARGGFSLVGDAVGFHLGAGLRTSSTKSGVRFEGRVHLFPNGEDWMLEALFTYQIKL